MARSLCFIFLASLLWGCGAPQTQTPESLPKPSGPAVSEIASKEPARQDEVKLLLDLEEYPGAKLVESYRLKSDQMSPDEVRFELLRTSADSPSEVIAFYEKNLGVKATISDKGGQEVYGRTKRGNYVKVHVSPDGKGSKFTLNVISYAK